METKSISRLLSLLELGGQTALVRIYPLIEPPGYGALSNPSGWPQGASSPAPSAAPWHADLYIQAGQLQYCAVFNAAGERTLAGEQALNFLGQIGGLSYDLLPMPAQPGSSPPGRASPPLPPPSGYTGPYQLPEEPAGPPPGAMAPIPARAPSPTNSWRPARTRWGELVAQNPHRLTRDQRRILALINGQRSVDELSRLLGVSPESLSEALAYFREQNLIA